MAFAYDSRIVYAGNVIEVSLYKQPILTEFKNKIEKTVREKTAEVIEENRKRSIKRTNKRIRDLVNANYVAGKSSFLTLTFKENLTDYDLAFYYWKLFIKKVKYRYGNMKYLGVVEFQTKNYETTGRRAIHFHVCLFDIGYIEQSILLELWNDITEGSVDIRELKNVDNVGAYLTSYLGKDLDQQLRFEEYSGRKRYFQSKDLIEPTVQLLNIREFKDDRETMSSILNALKDNVVYEYISKPIEIFKRHWQEVDETNRIIQSEQVAIEGIITKKEYLNGYAYDMYEGLDNDFERKKELSESLAYIQQIHYKQIILSKNNQFRLPKKI